MYILLRPVCVFTVLTCVLSISMKQEFLSSANSDLPDGALIAAGPTSIAELADYLDANRNIIVTRLLLSDSNVWDFENNYGFLETAAYADDIDVPDEEEDKCSYNNKVRRRRARALRNLTGTVDRIMNRTSSSLESLSYLLYIPKEDRYEPKYTEPWLDEFLGHDSLTRHGPSNRTPHFLTRYEFPRLKELVLKDHSNCQHGSFCDDAWTFSANLTHLHLILDERDHRNTLSISSLRETLPNLTLVRFTGRVSKLWTWEAINLTWIQSAWLRLGGLVPRYKKRFIPVPENLTLIIHPDYEPDLRISGLIECGTASVEYNEMLRELGGISGGGVHLSWPIQEDYRKYSVLLGLFPVDRAIKSFKDRVLGGEGDWKIPEGGEWKKPSSYWWKSVQHG